MARNIKNYIVSPVIGLLCIALTSCEDSDDLTSPPAPPPAASGSISISSPSDGSETDLELIDVTGSYSVANASAAEVVIKESAWGEIKAEDLGGGQFVLREVPTYSSGVMLEAELRLTDGTVLATDSVSFSRNLNVLRSGKLNASGGTISDTDPGSSTQFARLDVPAGALGQSPDDEVIFEFTEPDDPAAVPAPNVLVSPYVTIQPFMLSMQPPATLTIPITDQTVDPSIVEVLAFDGFDWINLSVTARSAASVSVTVPEIA